jgi:hypothetical protein
VHHARLWIAAALLVAVDCAARAEAPGRPAEAELVVVVDAEYAASHGWGHVWRCRVREVRRGALVDDVLHVSSWATARGQGGLLSLPATRFPSLLLGFRRRPDLAYGPPPGFRASDGTYWEMVLLTRAP